MVNHFNFKRLDDGQVLLTNDFGRYLFLSADEFSQFLKGTCSENADLSRRLSENGFLIGPMDLYSNALLFQLRRMKNYVFSATTLHIFVVATACNLKCVYCQAQDEINSHKGFMSVETAHAAVDTALQSPARELTFEFQGGEPLINFPIIKEVVEYTKQNKGDKLIDFTVVTNLSLLTPEMAAYFVENHITVSTSLDGPDFLHNRNRVAEKGDGSHSRVMDGIEILHKAGENNIGAIQTTTRYSLPYAKEIVREYRRLGMPGVFLRPLTPLGFAKTKWDDIGYTPEEWLQFYKEAFDEILKINLEGTCFPEQHAAIFLRKILTGEAENYMELRSPCGAGIGQMAYYHNGDVYTCDEARMISEAGNQAFRLGNVFENSYQEMVSSGTCQGACTASILESVPGCCDCVYQPYCGLCPVVTYATEGDVFPKATNEYRCSIYKGILDTIFSFLRINDERVIQIFNSWIGEEYGE